MKELKDMSLEELWRLFPIILKEHDPNCAVWYKEEQASLCRILKEHCIYRISHIGSTSVAGLIAKPTVDILLELEKGYDKEAVADILQNNGWGVMARDDAAQTMDLCKGYTPQGFAQRVFHLHSKPAGDWNELYFRDYLREHADIAREYERLKLELKEKHEHDRDAYTHAKSDFILTYTQKARNEFGGRYLPNQR